ncbi:MAG: metallophosphoesterase [Aerococcus sp.]|nr:metallophosphoesterase [Aerococcus sp.]
MSKIVIVSDNHGDQEILKMIVERHQDEATAFIHCGDSEGNVEDPIWQSFTVVQGNMDFADFPLAEVVSVPEGKIMVTHGHRFDIKRDLNVLASYSKEAGCEVACFGHSHVMTLEEVQGVLMINPGSIRLPRGQYPHPTYAMLDWEADGTKMVTYYHRDGSIVPDPFV